MKILPAILRLFFLYLLLSVGCFLMLRIILGYSSFRTDVQFLLRKQDYLGNPFWLAAFYVHVFSAILILFAGFTQFSKDFLQQNRVWHRRLGRVYVWNILAVNAPVGMVLAIYANGLWPGKTAFILLDVLWFVFTWKALHCARNHDFPRHKDFMIRSYALTLSALTLRSWKMILAHHIQDPLTLYVSEAWLGFIPNLLLAEIFIRWKKPGPITVGKLRGNLRTR